MQLLSALICRTKLENRFRALPKSAGRLHDLGLPLAMAVKLSVARAEVTWNCTEGCFLAYHSVSRSPNSLMVSAPLTRNGAPPTEKPASATNANDTRRRTRDFMKVPTLLENV